MSKSRFSPVALAIALLACLSIGVGLALTGGPLQGRKERRDMVRQQDLMRLSDQAICLFGSKGLTGTGLDPTAACPDDPRQVDPYTQEPYRIEVVDARHMRFCASFELDRQDAPWLLPYGGQWQDGCVVTRLGDSPAQ